MESSAARQVETPVLAPRLADAQLSPGRGRAALLARWLVTADVLSGALAALAVFVLPGVSASEAIWLAVVTAAAWPLVSFSVGVYSGDDLRFWVSGISEVPRTLVAAVLFSWPVFIAAALLDIKAAGLVAFAVVALTLGVSGLSRATVRGMLHRVPALSQRVLILGSGMVAGQLADKLRTHEQFGLAPIGILDDDAHPDDRTGLPRLGALQDLRSILAEQRVDRVIIAFSRASHEQLLESIRVCRDAGVAVDVVPRLFELLHGVRSLDQVGGLPILSIGSPRLSRGSTVAKRALDFAVAALAILVLLPVLLVVAIAIKLDSRGPVFFKQPRVGRNGRMFNLYKLRSMRVNADNVKDQFNHVNDSTDGVMFKIHADPRVTRVGRILRRYSLDEAPQLFNVLRGDMSIVGPRPLIRPETDALAEDWHLRRLELRPGLTGPWQIYGRSETPFQEMVRLDYQYVAGWSLARDVEILLATVPAVLSGRGAY